MSPMSVGAMLSEAAGVPVTAAQAASFDAYHKLLMEWNQKINLTAITGEGDVAYKHFLDSISLLPYLPQSPFRAIDVGTGAGFPGLPLAIMRGDMSLALLDALQKRVLFLQEAAELLALPQCYPLHGRAEETARDPAHREQYDVCFARAVTAFAGLAELCMAFVKLGGLFLAMKGPAPEEEAAQGLAAVRAMGGEIESIQKVPLPYTSEGSIVHSVIIVRKNYQTPPGFPRKYAKIKKSPLF